MEERETLGSLFLNKCFHIHLILLAVFIVVLVITVSQNFWVDVFEINIWLMNLVITVNYIGTLNLTSTVISWVLVDQNSWLANALIFLFVGSILVFVDTILMFKMFDSQVGGPNDRQHALAVQNHTFIVYDYQSKLLLMQAVISINFFQGLYGIIFFVYFCAMFDKVHFK